MKNELLESLFLIKNSEVHENLSLNEQKLYYYDDKRERNIFDAEKIKTTLGTETITKVDKESTDRDVQYLLDQIMGTETLTEVKREGTDTDKNDEFENLVKLLGTETKTAVKREKTDTDDDNYFILSELQGTETKTFTRNEDTDSAKENLEALLDII